MERNREEEIERWKTEETETLEMDRCVKEERGKDGEKVKKAERWKER